MLIKKLDPALGRVTRDRSGIPMNMGSIEETARRTVRALLEKTRLKRKYRVIPYVNYAVLLRRPLKPYYHDILFNSALENDHIINRSGIEQVWKEHLDLGSWKQEQIGILATVDLFYGWYFKS
jgi:hypothetical protein